MALLPLVFVIISNGCGKENGNKTIILPPQPPIPKTWCYEKPAGAIRILTYNTFYCKSNTSTQAFNATNTRNVANVIRALDADIVALQELDSGVAGRSSRFLLEELRVATEIDYQLFFGPAALYDGGTIGCGLLVKRSLPVQQIEKIALPGKEPRMLLVAHLTDFVVMATHFDLDVVSRKRSAEIINHQLKSIDKPIFLVGDLNDSPAWPPTESAFPLLNQHFMTAATADGDPKASIDYVLVAQKYADRITNCNSHTIRRIAIDGVIKELESVSDHFPLILDVSVTP